MRTTGNNRPGSGSAVRFGLPAKFRLLLAASFLLLGLAGLVFTLGNTHAAGVSWEINNAFYTNDSNCTVAVRQCSSIITAVNRASPGDTLNVAAGSSVYDGFIVNTAGLTILGPNADYNPVTTSRVSEAQIISTVTIQPSATGVTVQGFEFNRSDSNVVIKAANTTLKNNNFSGLLSTAISASGPFSNLAIESNLVPVVSTAISVKQVSHGHVSGNRLGNTTSTYIDTGLVLDAVSDFQVSENIITNISNQGVLLVNNSGPSSSLTISDNYFSRTNNSAVPDQGAIQIYGDNAASPNPLTITNNIFQTSRNGVTVTTGGTLGSNTSISNNCFSATVVTYGDLYNGASSSLTAPNNYSAGLDPTTAGPGTVVVSPYLPSNAITTATNPSIEAGTAGQSVVLGQVKNSAGIAVANQIVSYHFQSSIGSNAQDGLLTSDSDGNLTLTLSQAVSLSDYNLVLNPTNANLNFPVNRTGCQGPISLTLKAAPPCTVNSNGGAGYTSIESALASTCTTIRVTGGGPYRSSLVLDHPVKLLGPNAEIDPNTDPGDRTTEVILLLTDGFYDPTDTLNRGTLVRLTSGNVTFAGFTLDGNNPSTTSGTVANGQDIDAAYGLTNRNSSGTALALNGLDIKNNIFQNFYIGAVRLDGISGAVSGNYIRNNKIDNVFPTGDDGYGVWMGDNFYAEVAGNSISRVRQGIKLAGFSAANPGTTASVHDNTVDSFTAGIRYGNSTGFTISANTLQSTLSGNANAGLWLTNLTASPAVTLSNNTISGGETGIKAWGVSAVAVSGGSITGANYGVYLYNYQTGASPETPDFASSMTLDGLTITGTTTAGVYLYDNTANAANDLTLSLQGGSQIINGAAGIVVAGQNTTLELHDTDFSGQSGDYITLQESGGDGIPGENIDARAATFESVAGASLSGGQYTAVQAKLTDHNDTATLGLVLLYNPVLAVSPQTLGFTGKVGGSNPLSQSITISNPVASAPSLDWNIAAPAYGSGPAGWLACTPTGGTLAAGESGHTDCQATTGSLANGIYTATVQVASTTPGVQNGSQTLTVTFTVVGLPVITADPLGQTIPGGQSVSLTVTATSLAPLTYQWYEGTTEGDSSPVGNNSPQFTSPTITEPTSYWVKVSNLAGSVNSALANITICGDFEVSSAADSGAATLCGTFSYALKQASLATQPVTITFAPAMTQVVLTGPLAPLTNPNQVSITIDGGCNQQNLPQVSLVAGTGSGPTGLSLTNHTTVQCLIVRGFSGFALSMQGDSNRLVSSWLGTVYGQSASGTGGGGVTISGNNNSLGMAGVSTSGNRIFSNSGSGVEVTGGEGNTACYNRIEVGGTLIAGAGAVKVSGGGQLKFGLGNVIRVGPAS